MKMRADAHIIDGAMIDRAAAALKAGFLVVIPTDTVYGIAADPSLDGARDRIYEAKKRDRGKPIPILVTGIGQAGRMGAQLDGRARKLAERFWPGPLTMVLRTASGFEGFRAPAHPAALALIEACGGALLATSANISGEPAARTAAEAALKLGSSVGFVLDTGPAPAGTESTVMKIDGNEIVYLREGALPRIEIEKCLKN